MNQRVKSICNCSKYGLKVPEYYFFPSFLCLSRESMPLSELPTRGCHVVGRGGEWISVTGTKMTLVGVF